MDFRKFIQTDRDNREKEKFNGTFLDYLEIVKENPDIAKLSHKRLYDKISEKGVEVLKGEENYKVKRIYGNEIIRKYGFFKDNF
ncbi:MAG: serine protein kinase, partial [Clostridium sp.]